jgi:hypothetical protein
MNLSLASQLFYLYPFRKAGEYLVRQVWVKGRIVPGYDPNLWRIDIRGFLMKFTDHGNTESKYGWEIDHIYPASKGGTDGLSNLQPLQWENNRRKGDNWPWSC